ncbi:MAG TPA: CotH kinase family protein, partial [Phycisphaerae bacterium]|nr:CotH kinase family protein [Phycisphaerae bacterium]
TFPACTLGVGEYRIVFASGRETGDPAHPADLHADFKLDADGEYVALVRPGGNPNDVVSEYYFGEQLEDVSYGVAYDVVNQTDLVLKGDDATYLVPPDDTLGLSWTENGFDDSVWTPATTGLGFGLNVSDERITLVAKGATWRYLDDGSNQGTGWSLSGFDDTSWKSGPAELGYGDGDEATVVGYGGDGQNRYITTYFRHTFTVENAWQISEVTINLLRDDGAVVYLNGQELFRDLMPEGAFDYQTLAAHYVSYGDETTYFEHTDFVNDPTDLLVDGENVLAVEIHQNLPTSTDISLDLEMIAATSTAGLYRTDIEADMKGVNGSVYVRIPFAINDPLEFTDLFLDIAYEDGYVAYLNGFEVASGNAPVPAQWNSTALQDRPVEQAVQFEGVDLTGYLDLLQPGENVLAIHAMNDAVGDSLFLMTPELVVQGTISVQVQYFTTPTPGAENIPGVVGMVGDTQFSFDRGFYTGAIDVAITTDTDRAEIFYTTDGSEPHWIDPDTYTGPISKYDAPVHIDETTTLRAMATKAGYLPTNIDTQTYIFLDDVILQDGTGLPAYWGVYIYNNPGQPRPANYDMASDVVNDPRYAGTIEDDLRSIPSMSIVMDPDQLWDNAVGIYSNTTLEGVAWERPCSVELIDTDGTSLFQVDAGIRIHGGWGRRPSINSKHSFRLLFKGEYGPTTLDYPLFADDAADADDSFDTIILRAGFNDQWRTGGTNITYIQDRWAAEVQNLNGGFAPHGTWVHLYLNGLYWGLYNPVERPNADFAASYFGGEKEDYDAYRVGGLIDGTSAAWNQLFGLIRAPSINYAAVQEMLDIPNFIDYMIINQFGGNWDWPHNNWYASRKREDGGKWYFHSWDAEGCLRDLNGNRVNNFGNNGPGEIYEKLRNVSEFRMAYADRIHRLLFNDGLLTPSENIETLNSIVGEIDRAIVGESARWGDGRIDQVSPDRTRDDHWLPRINWLRNTYFPQRTAIVLDQFKSAGLYPTLAAPTFNQHGGQILPGFPLTMNASTGTIYYTTDGSDPRLIGGGTSSAASTLPSGSSIVLAKNTTVKARVKNGGEWSALHEATFVLDEMPNLVVTEIMYNPADPTPAE